MQKRRAGSGPDAAFALRREESFLLADLRRRREVEARREEDHLVELEGPIFVGDLVVRERRIRRRAARVEPAAVVRERERAVLDVDADEARRVEREAEAE